MDPLERAREAFLRAVSLQERGDLAGAESLYREALALAPERASVMNNLAALCLARGRHEEAGHLCSRLLELDPGDETALLNLGNARFHLGDAPGALAAYDGVLERNPRNAQALNNRGNVLSRTGRLEEALASYDRALAVDPGFADAHYNRGNVLLELRRPADAAGSYEDALAIRSDRADALYGLGNALMALARPAEALARYDAVLALDPAHVRALVNRGAVLAELGRREELVAACRRLLAVAPDHPYQRGYLLNALLHCCDWSGYDATVADITAQVRAGARADTPFHFLAISHSPADQLACARICAADEYPVAGEPVWRGERYGHQQIRVAYLSADMHNHAIPFLIAGVIEAHDRTRFDVTGISLGPERNDAMRERLKGAFDRFIDARHLDDRGVAARLRALEIDIAVDLQGYTRGCRPGIFAHRGAPVQVNWLGYPGTMGASCMDYIIADANLIPPEDRVHYSEQVVYLPDCYQPNDAKRGIAARTPPRAELGLPDEGFVFCCFNNNYKIAPETFEAWMRLLSRVEGSVLWLLEDNAVASRNLRREAGQRGVAAERLVFAPRMKMEEHLARHRQADLFLDTLPYCAHTTASDALWAGLPVLTCRGGTFAGRVAASLLHAVGLPELVTATREEYERLALALATDRERLAGIRAKLARHRTTHPLFDTGRFRRHIESAYFTLRERAERGQPPASFAVREIR